MATTAAVGRVGLVTVEVGLASALATSVGTGGISRSSDFSGA